MATIRIKNRPKWAKPGVKVVEETMIKYAGISREFAVIVRDAILPRRGYTIESIDVSRHESLDVRGSWSWRRENATDFCVIAAAEEIVLAYAPDARQQLSLSAKSDAVVRLKMLLQGRFTQRHPSYFYAAAGEAVGDERLYRLVNTVRVCPEGNDELHRRGLRQAFFSVLCSSAACFEEVDDGSDA